MKNKFQRKSPASALLIAGLLLCSLGSNPARAEDQGEQRQLKIVVPAFDQKIVDGHKQIYDMSCIPMSVEMVLKLLKRVPALYYDQQHAWQNKTDGNFSNFDGKAIEGVTFHKQFGLPRDKDFPLEKLFATIDTELKAGRFVIISLTSGNGWHMHVIYSKDADGDFVAVSKSGPKTTEVRHVKKIVTKMKGTDILTYKISANHGTSLAR